MKRLFFIGIELLLTVTLFSQSWSLTGNAGTTNANFVGTTDDNPFSFKVNNQWAGFSGAKDKFNVSFGYLSFGNVNPSTGGNSNTAFGAQTLQYNYSGYGNVAVGHWALLYNNSNYNVAIGLGAMCGIVKGDDNVAIGKYALLNNKQSQNTVIGSEAGQNNTDGFGLTAVGFKTLNYNTTGDFNTALGYQALLYNTTGYWNVALGSGSLQSNTTGRFNTAGGNSSMHFNQEGVENTAFGEQALGGNINGSFNTAVGCRSLHSVLWTPATGDSGYGEGVANTAVGYESLQKMTSGTWNTGLGVRALQNNTTGNGNIGIGGYALAANITGSDNIAIGNQALNSNTAGSNNTAIGYYADVSSGNLTNATAIGAGAVSTASNQVTIGNQEVTSIRGAVSWSTYSDKRMTKNIQANVPGLSFIKKLQPVTYNLNLGTGTNSTHDNISYTGFIAQDVEKVAKSIGYNFSGIDIAEKDDSMYSLRYSNFIAPLVQAVQELSAQNEEKDSAIVSLQQQIDKLTEAVNRLSGNNTALKSVSVPTTSLEQNYPNPFNQSTTINYSLTQISNSAKIVLSDMSGRIFKQIPISGIGEGNVKIDAGELSPGVYFYSLYMDNTLVDTKKMIVAK